jgi:ribosome-binding factor A
LFILVTFVIFKAMENYTTRQNKISRLIQKEVADIFIKNKESFHGKLISVTMVRVTRDLSIARIYLSIFPSEGSKDTLNNILLHTKSFRGELGRRVGKILRIIPELEFHLDDSLDYLEKIDRLLKNN